MRTQDEAYDDATFTEIELDQGGVVMVGFDAGGYVQVYTEEAQQPDGCVAASTVSCTFEEARQLRDALNVLIMDRS